MGEIFESDFSTWCSEVRDLATESRVEDLAAAVYWRCRAKGIPLAGEEGGGGEGEKTVMNIPVHLHMCHLLQIEG